MFDYMQFAVTVDFLMILFEYPITPGPNRNLKAIHFGSIAAGKQAKEIPLGHAIFPGDGIY